MLDDINDEAYVSMDVGDWSPVLEMILQNNIFLELNKAKCKGCVWLIIVMDMILIYVI